MNSRSLQWGFQMRPNVLNQSNSVFALNEVFGTRAHVRLLRVLATEPDQSITSSEAAVRAGMTPSGARKALRRLSDAGVVEKVDTGTAIEYVLNRDGRLAEEIVRLFELERQSAERGWARERRLPVSPATQGNGNGGRVDPRSSEFNDALVSLLEEDLSLIRRAREKVQEKLANRHPGNGHDDWEWRKVLDTYPLPRLLHFLESDSPRAVRLRKSSPFPEVMSERERERLGELIEGVN